MAPMIIPIQFFSMENDGSLREAPLLDVSIKLCAQFAVDGFLSKLEPVMIRLKDQDLKLVFQKSFSKTNYPNKKKKHNHL